MIAELLPLVALPFSEYPFAMVTETGPMESRVGSQYSPGEGTFKDADYPRSIR